LPSGKYASLICATTNLECALSTCCTWIPR